MDWSEQQARFGALIQPKSVSNQPKPQPNKKKRNFWLDQISTATGTLGGIGGGILGAAAGGIGAIPGAAAGGAAGAGIGEAIENMIDPSTGDKGNILEEALLGGAFAAGPLRLGKTVAGASSALRAGTAGSVKQAVRTASDSAAKSSIRGAIGKKATDTADSLVAKQFRFTPSQLTNFNKRHGEDAVSVIKRYGFQNADDVTVKGIEPLQSAFDEVVTKVPTLSKRTVQSGLSKVYKPLMNSVNLTEKQLGQQLKTQADEIMKLPGDSIESSAINNLRKSFDNAVKYTQRGAPDFNVNKETADALRKILQKEADKAGLGFQGKTFKEIGKDLTKLYDLQENITRQANLGRGSSPLNLLTLVGGGMGGAAGGPVGAVGTAIGTAAANSPMGRRALASSAKGLGGRLSASGNRAASNAMSPSRIGGRILGGNIGVKAIGGSFSPSTEQSTPDSLESALMQSGNPMVGAQPTDLQQPQSQNPYSRENLLADIQRDPTNAKDYIDYFTMLEEVFNPQMQEQKPLNQGQQERADLIKALDITEDVMAGGSINYGPIGSRVEGIKSMFNAADPETLTFKNTVSGLRAAITKARAGASLTPGELKMLAQYTPSDTDSEQQVRSKLAQLRALYGYEAPTGGGTTLEDMLMSQQPAY